MKVLFPTVDRSIRVATHFDQFKKAFAKVCDVDFINTIIPSGYKTGNYATQVMNNNIKPVKIVDNYLKRKKYDFIVTDADFIYVHEDWAHLNIPKAMIIEDSQTTRNPKLQMQWAIKNKFDIIFYKYKKSFEQNYGHMKIKKIWIPHSVDIELFKDYKLPKEYQVLMVGQCYGQAYPHRTKVYNLIKDKPYFTKIGRPMECNQGECVERWPIGKDYAKVLNKSDICITGGSVFDFPVMKYFEIPASRSLLMSNWFPELSELGFVPGINMVIADFKNLDNQIRCLLNNKKLVENVQDHGYDLIRERHSIDTRAAQMKEEMEKWLKNR